MKLLGLYFGYLLVIQALFSKQKLLQYKDIESLLNDYIIHVSISVITVTYLYAQHCNPLLWVCMHTTATYKFPLVTTKYSSAD